jgi:glycosyltransferase involved in cell wall biosynthesis
MENAQPLALLCYQSEPDFYPEPMFAPKEVFLGPDVKAETRTSVRASFKSELGTYDLAKDVARLGIVPDIVVVKPDALERSVPRNLASVPGVKVLVLGDTHHIDKPISWLLEYAVDEKFDLIICHHARQHLHFFENAALAPTAWLPLLSVNPHIQPLGGEMAHPISFAGSASPRWHPCRVHLLDRLKAAGIVPHIATLPQPQTAPLFARSLISLNVSLNGDINHRVGEVMGAGGFLLTDRLAPEAGLGLLFEEGKHLVCYEGEEELIAKARSYLAHPEATRAIREAGQQAYLAQHAPAVKMRQFLDLALEGKSNPAWDIAAEPRHRFAVPEGPIEFLRRVAVYEAAQEHQRRMPNSRLVFFPGIDPAHLSDAADLTRSSLIRLVDQADENARVEDLLAKTSTLGRFKALPMAELGSAVGDTCMFIMPSAAFHALTPDQLPPAVAFPELALTSEVPPALSERLAKLGYRREGRFQWLRPVRPMLGEAPLDIGRVAASPKEIKRPRIAIDAVFYQDYLTGIARVWEELLRVWVKDGFAQHLLILDRDGFGPEVQGLARRNLPPHIYDALESDRDLLEQVCNEEGIDLFVSTFCTTPRTRPTIFAAYDMIPEVLGVDPLADPMWREKHDAITYANCQGYVCISESTAKDLKRVFPSIKPEQVHVAHCGVNPIFRPAPAAEVAAFKQSIGVSKPYFLLVGQRQSYKNGILFFKGFAGMANKDNFMMVNSGAKPIEEEFIALAPTTPIVFGRMSDEQLRLAYCGATALVFPSYYEGFGMPVIEAMACGCPVITTPCGSLPEVAGPAALYVNPQDDIGMTRALLEVQLPEVRKNLIEAGFKRAQLFSWTDMAAKIKALLLATAGS